MDDKEYELLKESIDKLWKSLEDLKREVQGIREDLQHSTEKSMESIIAFNGLCKDFKTYQEIHRTEHDGVWIAIRALQGKTEKAGKGAALWLDIIWKLILISGVIIVVILGLHKAGII
jgi:hypothetical protein